MGVKSIQLQESADVLNKTYDNQDSDLNVFPFNFLILFNTIFSGFTGFFSERGVPSRKVPRYPQIQHEFATLIAINKQT